MAGSCYAFAMSHFPPWIRVRVPADGGAGRSVGDVLSSLRLHTVCQGAHCPNQAECYGAGTATFLILGDTCTRRCAFCAVANGVPSPPDLDEPRRVAEAAACLALRHVVVTSVTRDDLPDGGAAVFAATIRALRSALPAASIEVLVPDFEGREADVAAVLDAAPGVLNHNVETVRRLQPVIRPAADYDRSLRVLRIAAHRRGGPRVKSGMMVGLGERPEEVAATMRDLREAGCEMLTIGQYLAPSPRHAPVARFVPPEEFDAFARDARALGFAAVASAPLVRSSYHAGEMLLFCSCPAATGTA